MSPRPRRAPSAPGPSRTRLEPAAWRARAFPCPSREPAARRARAYPCPSREPAARRARAYPCPSREGGDASLGPGIDASFEGGFRLRARGGSPSALCALAAEIRPGQQGRGLSSAALRAMARLASGAGLGHLIAPVRPNLKERYPTIPIERYTAWKREDGTPFDPWIRVHTRIGGRLGPALPRSMRITGSVADWESWTRMQFPETGDYVFPAGLAPVHIDRDQGTGRYWEPNVWLVHRT